MNMGRYSYIKALKLVTEWAKGEGYEDITLDHNDISQIDWKRSTLNSPKNIKIQGKYCNELKLYLMLHELGHHQLRKDWDKFKKKLPITAYAEYANTSKRLGKYKRRVTYSVSCVEEEYKAWDEGYKLGERLGVRINEKKWTSIKAKCLIGYIRYYGTKKYS